MEKLHRDIIFEILQKIKFKTKFILLSYFFKDRGLPVIEKIPDEYRFNLDDNIISKFPDLTELNISYYTKISASAIYKLKKIKTLNVENNLNKFNEMSEHRLLPKNLTSLNASDTNISDEQSIYLINLKELICFNRSPYKPLTLNFSNLERLETDVLGGNIVFKNLKHLVINWYTLDFKIPESLRVYSGPLIIGDGDYSNIEYLNISQGRISLDDILKLKKLRYLSINIPLPIIASNYQRIENLSHLRYLSGVDFSFTDVSIIPHLPNLIYLKIINANYIELTKISKNIKYLICIDSAVDLSSLMNLEYLKMDKCIYLNLEKLLKLKYLSINDCQCCKLFPASLVNLETLILRSLWYIEGIIKYPKLKYLNVFDCPGIQFNDIDIPNTFKYLNFIDYNHSELRIEENVCISSKINYVVNYLKMYYVSIGSKVYESHPKNIFIDRIYHSENGEELRIINEMIPSEFINSI